MTVPILTVTPFDYGAMAPELATTLRQQADHIKRRIANTTVELIEIGRDLAAAKQHLDHGQFVEWVEAEVGIVKRTAQAYMAAARLAETKSATVALLPPSTVHRLASKSAPPEVVEAVFAQAASGNIPSDSVVAEMISEARFQKRQAEAAELRSTRERRMSKQKRAERARQLSEQKREQAERTETAQINAADIIDRFDVDGAKFILDMVDGPFGWETIAALRTALS